MADRTLSGFHLSSFVFLMFSFFFHEGHSFRQLSAVAAPHYMAGDLLMVKVSNLASTKPSRLPYPYYSMPYCRPQQIVDSYRNLWEVLRGDRIQNSPYEFHMREAMMCKMVCRLKLDKQGAKVLKEKIDDEYRVNMFLDNLPLVVQEQSRTDCDSRITYQDGYDVGHKVQDVVTKEEQYFINNHLSFVVKYHKDVETSAARVVGFEVKASSIEHKFDDGWGTHLTTCDPHAKHQITVSPQEIDDNKEITFTYDVEYQETDYIEWSSRSDTDLPMDMIIKFAGLVGTPLYDHIKEGFKL